MAGLVGFLAIVPWFGCADPATRAGIVLLHVHAQTEVLVEAFATSYRARRSIVEAALITEGATRETAEARLKPLAEMRDKVEMTLAALMLSQRLAISALLAVAAGNDQAQLRIAMDDVLMRYQALVKVIGGFR